VTSGLVLASDGLCGMAARDESRGGICSWDVDAGGGGETKHGETGTSSMSDVGRASNKEAWCGQCVEHRQCWQ
jgi:hypothetical protein